jgi:hypothetical protein
LKMKRRGYKWAVFIFFACSSPAWATFEETVGGVNNLLYGIAAGIAILLITLHAIRWKTAENLTDRNEAKKGIMNVIIGLIIIMIAGTLVTMLFKKPQAGNYLNCSQYDGWYENELGNICIGGKICQKGMLKEYREYSDTWDSCSFSSNQSATSCKGAVEDCPVNESCVAGTCVPYTAATTTTTTTTTTTFVPGHAKTVKCQTNLECYEKLGICWTCPVGGGDCLTWDKETHSCPDCGNFPKGFTCFYGKNGYGPYCCYDISDKLDDPKCKDGTPLNSCSTKYPGLYCISQPDELKPNPSCGGVNCTDSDGGKDPLTKGVCSDVIKYYTFSVQENDYTDRCVQQKLVETFCEGNQCKQETVDCPPGKACNSPGACI